MKVIRWLPDSNYKPCLWSSYTNGEIIAYWWRRSKMSMQWEWRKNGLKIPLQFTATSIYPHFGLLFSRTCSHFSHSLPCSTSAVCWKSTIKRFLAVQWVALCHDTCRKVTALPCLLSALPPPAEAGKPAGQMGGVGEGTMGLGRDETRHGRGVMGLWKGVSLAAVMLAGSYPTPWQHAYFWCSSTSGKG